MAKERRRPESIIRRKKQAAALRAERRRLGLCYRCGAPVLDGIAVCQKHKTRNDLAAKKYMASDHGRKVSKKWRYTVGRFARIVNVSRRHGREWALTESAWRAIISAPCYYCGLPLNVVAGAGMDRLNNDLGYIEGNVVSCCRECNTARSNNFSPEEMRLIGAAIRTVKLKRMYL